MLYVTILWMLLSFACFWKQDLYKEWCDFFTAWGTITSVIGFAVALWQIVMTRKDASDAKTNAEKAKTSAENVKNQTDQILTAVRDNVKRVNQIMSCSDIRDYTHIPKDISRLVNQQQYLWALEKMDDLCLCLNSLKHNPDCKEKIEIGAFITELLEKKDDLNSLYLGNGSVGSSVIKVTDIHKFLSAVENFLGDLAGKLKFSKINEVLHD